MGGRQGDVVRSNSNVKCAGLEAEKDDEAEEEDGDEDALVVMASSARGGAGQSGKGDLGREYCDGIRAKVLLGAAAIGNQDGAAARPQVSFWPGHVKSAGLAS